MNASLLIVDDDDSIRKMLARHFRYKGFDVETAANGREALEVLGRRKVNIVITDIEMPEMDGIELLRTMMVQYPFVRRIVITGNVSLDCALACMRAGADTFIFKPLVDLTKLDSAVEKAVETIRHWFDLLKELRAMNDENL